MNDLLKLKALESAVKEAFGVIPVYEPASRFGGCKASLTLGYPECKDAAKIKEVKPFGTR